MALKPNQVQVCFSAVPNANKTSNHLLLTLPPFSQSSTSTALRILDFSMSLHVLTYSTPNRQVFGIIPSHPLPLPMPTSELVLTKICYHFSIFLLAMLASQNPMRLSRSASHDTLPYNQTFPLLLHYPDPKLCRVESTAGDSVLVRR